MTLENAYHLLLDQSDLDEAMSELASASQTTLPPAPVVEHFTIRFLAQPPKQIGSGKETIGNYLQAFVTPEIAQVFCPGANTFASPTSTAERYRRVYAARIPGGVPLREHVLEDALLCFSPSAER
jgi:hypothetical protein